jgi:dipeptidyl aminopeptidase/acylaminoacyl peptidase
MKHRDGVNYADFSPDGRWIVTASQDYTARIWDAVTGKPIGEPMKHYGGVNCAQFSPDGRRIVTASQDNTARIWDAVTGQPIGEPMKHGGWVVSAEFSPDGQRILTASLDHSARLWDSTTGKAISEPLKHQDGVCCAHFSPDGQRVLTASRDKTARLWDVPTVSSKDTAESVQLLAELAEANGDAALETVGQAEILNTLTSDQVKEKRAKILATLGRSSSLLTPLEQFLKWSVSDRRSRTVSPFSNLTVPEWIKNRVKEGTLEGLRWAIQLEPADGQIATTFGKILADQAPKAGADSDEARRFRAQANFQAYRASQLNGKLQ